MMILLRGFKFRQNVRIKPQTIYQLNFAQRSDKLGRK